MSRESEKVGVIAVEHLEKFWVWVNGFGMFLILQDPGRTSLNIF